MNHAATPAASAPASSGYLAQHWPAIGMTVIVLALSFYAFAPRPAPEFKPTQVYPDRIIVNGLAGDGTRFVAAGEHGLILVGDASGNWTQGKVSKARGSTLTAARFVAKDVAVAVGHDGWILRSEDGGSSWTEVAFDAQAENGTVLLGLAGPYDGKLFAFGGFGQFLSSTDLGKTWTREEHAALADRHLNAMTQAADGSLVLVGERGLIAQSRDQGATWAAQKEIYPGSFFGVLTLQDKSLLVHGMRGHVFLSRDFGQTWKESKVPQVVSLFGGTVLADGRVVLVGASNAMFVSGDGGATFTSVSPRARESLASVAPLPSGEVLTAGEGGLRTLPLTPQPGAGNGNGSAL